MRLNAQSRSLAYTYTPSGECITFLRTINAKPTPCSSPIPRAPSRPPFACRPRLIGDPPKVSIPLRTSLSAPKTNAKVCGRRRAQDDRIRRRMRPQPSDFTLGPSESSIFRLFCTMFCPSLFLPMLCTPDARSRSLQDAWNAPRAVAGYVGAGRCDTGRGRRGRGRRRRLQTEAGGDECCDLTPDAVCHDAAALHQVATSHADSYEVIRYTGSS